MRPRRQGKETPLPRPEGLSLIAISLFITSLVLLWYLVALSVGEYRILPTPKYLVTTSIPSFANFSQETYSGNPWLTALKVLSLETLRTFWRVCFGIGLGILLGTVTGVILFLPLKANRVADSLLAAIRGVPLLALIPLFVISFGRNVSLAIHTYIFFAVLVISASDSYRAATALHRNLINRLILHGATRLEVLKHLVLPKTLRSSRSTIRTIVGLSWAFALGAELIAHQGGLGQLVRKSYMQPDMGKLFTLLVLYGVLGTISVAVLDKLFRHLLPRELTR